MIALCREHDIPLRLHAFTVEQARDSQEAFVTGTFGGLTPVREIDGRRLSTSLPGPVTSRLRGLYERLKDFQAAAGR